MTFTSLESTAQLFYSMSLNLGSLIIKFMHLGEEYHVSDVVSSSVYHIRRHMSICPIPGDVHFNHLVKMI